MACKCQPRFGRICVIELGRNVQRTFYPTTDTGSSAMDLPEFSLEPGSCDTSTTREFMINGAANETGYCAEFVDTRGNPYQTDIYSNCPKSRRNLLYYVPGAAPDIGMPCPSPAWIGEYESNNLGITANRIFEELNKIRDNRTDWIAQVTADNGSTKNVLTEAELNSWEGNLR